MSQVGAGPAAPAHGTASLQDETQTLLARLIRFDTVNPPGNERPAQEYLAAYLGDAGFECELLGAEPQRPNLIARLPAARAGAGSPPGGRDGSASRAQDGPTLAYIGHVDTVLADREKWTHDPWSGEVADGFMWGRGSLDMKSQVAAEAVAAASLARSGWRPARGELLLVTLVDEETGGSLGAEWITTTHPDKVRCDLLVNEGAGAVIELAGERIYGVCCAEKGVFRFTVTTDGVAGHASMPSMGENALLKMAPLLARLGARQPSYELTAVPRAFLQAIGCDPDDLTGAVARLRSADPLLATLFEPMLGVTFAPTRISASEKINVIPSHAVLKVDCRVPPGLGEDQVRRAIAEVLGPEDGFRVDFTERIMGNSSPVSSPLMDAIGEWVSGHDPGARTAPTILPGFTDSRHFRVAFPDCVAYGFFPHRHQSLLATQPLIHGADERIDVRDLGFAAEFFRDLALRFLG